MADRRWPTEGGQRNVACKRVPSEGGWGKVGGGRWNIECLSCQVGGSLQVEGGSLNAEGGSWRVADSIW